MHVCRVYGIYLHPVTENRLFVMGVGFFTHYVLEMRYKNIYNGKITVDTLFAVIFII